MFEKALDALERIATALERIAAYAGTTNVKVPSTTVADPKVTKIADDAKAAGKGKSATTTKTETVKKDVAAVADDGLGQPLTFEDMRNKLVTVKHNDKLGPAKSSEILAKYGKLNEIKEDKFAEVIAACDKLLASVGA